jgi:hypothetical protein
VSVHDWQKSSFSGEAANCLYVAAGEDGSVKLRESDAPGDIVTTTPAGLRSFIRSVQAGEFDQFLEV